MKIVHLALVLALSFALPAASQQRKVRPEFRRVKDVAGLPRVLIIGDSISIGYTLALRQALEGVANVHRPPENCESTREGLAKLDHWLGAGKWDLIQFNWGLHDLKYVDAQGNRVAVDKGKQKVPLEGYRRNLEELVGRLEKTGAILIWRPTTPVPPGAAGRIPGSEAAYNEAAAAIMARHGIRIDDMNAFIRDRRIPHVEPDNVHFSKESSARLAEEAAGVIRRALEQAGH